MRFSFLRYFIFFALFISCAYANALPALKDPIVTPIVGLTVTTNPGSIVIVNNTGKDIPLRNMLLTFNLDQNAVASLWGSPWLNWITSPTGKSFAKKLKDVRAYAFINQANLDGNTFRSGQTINVQYSPQPWNNPNAPTNVQLFNVSYPLFPAQITATSVSQGGVQTITITNTSGQVLSLANAQLRMTYNGQITSSIWGSPWGNWSITQGSPNYVLSAGAATQIPINGTLTASFNGDNQVISNIQLWTQSSQPITNKGEIDIAIPAIPAGVTMNPQITIQGPSFPQPQTIIGTWGQTLVQQNLQSGSYTITAPDLNTPNFIYTATLNPNPAVVSSSAAVNVTLTYTAKQLGQLTLQMPAAPAVGVAAPVVTVTGPDFPSGKQITTSWGNTFAVCASGTSCPGINAGNYTVTAPKIFSTTDAYTATNLNNPYAVNVGQTTNVPLAFSQVVQGTFTVNISLPVSAKKKLPKDQTFQVNFTGQGGATFSKTLAAGANSVSLPSNDTYTITPQTVAGYSVVVNPTSIAVATSGTPNVSIQYALGSAQKFVVYYGGWFGGMFNLSTQLPNNVTALNLSFANITSNYQVDTAASGYLTNVPAPNTQMWPSYINWTVFKYNRPNTKVILAVGGATYSAIWTSVLTPTSADTIAKNIATVVNQTYPVYSSQFSYPADLLGQVSIDGVDLDIEAGGRLTPQIANNVILLAQKLKQYLNPGKLITMASFSVGADPNDSNCTVPGSIHCGEDIPLLQGMGNLLDWVDVMAYDAGQDYATSKYQVALANYASYLPKSKILLGLDIQSQWPGFQETAQQLAVKALWQKQNGYAGSMFWGVSVTNNVPLEVSYINTISGQLTIKLRK